MFLHLGFIHPVVFMVIKSINTAVIKRISKKFHLKSPCKVGLGSNIMYLEGGNVKKSGKVLSSSVDMIALQNMASTRNESAVFPPMLHLQQYVI